MALVLFGAVLVVGCSGGDDESSSGDDDSAGEATAADGATPDGSGAGGADVPPVAVPPEMVEQDAGQGRRRTFTANLALGVEEVEPAVEQASAAVTEIGGFTEIEDVDLSGDGRASATYRVPADQFDATLDALGALGKVRTQDVRSTDVTSQYADLASRVAALRTSVERRAAA